MKKQIIYQKTIPRLFAACLDSIFLLLIFALLTPILNLFYEFCFFGIFREIIEKNPLEVTAEYTSARSYMADREFLAFLIESASKGKMSLFLLCRVIPQIIVLGLYFLGFWISRGTTPGKAILGMKIVDETTLGKAKISGLVKRFIFYPTAIIGIFFAVFTKKRQALHDKIAGTLVINS